ncbi:MAG: glutathione synthase [Pseudomonadales bacterium]|nr:glutathione synthase [Pseudomonadales bacterium]
MIKLGIVMDPIESINYKKDSSLAMLLEAQNRGWPIYYMEQKDLFIENGKAYAHCRSLIPKNDPNEWYSFQESSTIELSELDVILMRKDPPFDIQYIYTTYMLELAEIEGTLIINKPQSLRDFNEKLFTARFPECCPPTLVTANKNQLTEFVRKHEDTIFKPLHGMGGMSIFRVKDKDPNLSVIIETLTENGATPIMAQTFIPEINQGDKRILLVDGEPIPYCLARVPEKGETRGNLAAGGTGRAQELSERDLWICKQIAPTLKAKGLIWVGLDVIGDFITEINITSPTCIREIDAAYGINISATLMDCIEDKLRQPR